MQPASVTGLFTASAGCCVLTSAVGAFFCSDPDRLQPASVAVTKTAELTNATNLPGVRCMRPPHKWRATLRRARRTGTCTMQATEAGQWPCHHCERGRPKAGSPPAEAWLSPSRTPGYPQPKAGPCLANLNRDGETA